jgi:hypothetical protein
VYGYLRCSEHKGAVGRELVSEEGSRRALIVSSVSLLEHALLVLFEESGKEIKKIEVLNENIQAHYGGTVLTRNLMGYFILY